MAIYLDEEMMGQNTVIGFPHVVLCMGFAALVEKDNKRSLVGIHFSGTGKTDRAAAVFAANMPIGEKIVAIYGSCNRSVRYEGVSNTAAAWKAEMTRIAKHLRYQGVARGFDTAVIGPRDGTYIQYDVNLMRGFPVRIYYKRNEKMAYGQRGGSVKRVTYASETVITDEMRANPKLLAHYTKLSKDRIEMAAPSSSAVVAKKGFFSKGNGLNEVDYAVRLDEVYVAP